MAAALENNREEILRLKRCTKCLLPETFPFIRFDEEGVCNYCHHFSKVKVQGEERLRQVAEPLRKKGGPDCIVMFSGGRDSSYALHYVKKVLGMNPIAFTYDWGMSTPQAESNQRRMCEALGVEQVLVRANIPQKRENIRKNIQAWLKKPDLGIIPLFMAGDKQFFRHVNRVATDRGIPLVFLGVNPFEKTDFKTGFCGVEPNFQAQRIYSLTGKGKAKLLSYYLGQFLRNPAYLNGSLPDTADAFFSFYSIKQEQLDLYHYIMWDENTVNDVLLHQYGWELAPDCPTTWRIGDGTAAFYNYIYYTVAGFTENDTLRSNQIRQGMLGREEALGLVREENRPREASLRWYFDTVGLDFDQVIAGVNAMPKLYERRNEPCVPASR